MAGMSVRFGRLWGAFGLVLAACVQPPEDKAPILCDGVCPGADAGVDAGVREDAAAPRDAAPPGDATIDRDAAAPADGGVSPPPPPQDAGGPVQVLDASAAAGVCAPSSVITLDTGLVASDYGRVFVAPFPGLTVTRSPVFVVASTKLPNGTFRTQPYSFDAANPSAVTKHVDLAGELMDVKAANGKLVVLTVDAAQKVHVYAIDATRAGTPDLAANDEVLGTSGACSFLVGSVFVAGQGDHLVALSGIACNTAATPWTGIGRTGKGLLTFDAKTSLMPATGSMPIVAMLFMPESMLPNGSGGFTLVGAPTYANFGSVGGTSAYVYTVNGTTLAVSTPVQVALAGANDMLGAVALGPGPRFAVKAMSPGPSTPVPSFFVGNVANATSALAGTGAPQLGFSKTTFATLDDAPMWDVRGSWRGSELLVSSVSLGTPGASGANL